jgi:ketosteroid isomerase-like protein
MRMGRIQGCRLTHSATLAAVLIILALSTFMAAQKIARLSVKTSIGQSGGSEGIQSVLDQQTTAWNRGDVNAFMKGYWQSDQTTFLGAGGMNRGWQAVLERYRRNYPDASAMGTLSFSDLEIHMLSADAAFVTGEYHLVRAADRPHGYFTLIFRRFPDGWRVIHDHTTAAASAGR